jgi:hypothetical protein
MDPTAIQKDIRVGTITKEHLDWLKHKWMSLVREARDARTATGLCAYASFLNAWGITSDTYPLYLDLLGSNNRWAAEVLLQGHEPETYLDCVVPNHFIVKTIFETLYSYKKNELYPLILRVFFGLLMKVYRSPQEGWALYPPTVADVNALGRILDKAADQDEPINRDVLDILAGIADLDRPHETDDNKKTIAMHAGRIRSDYFDRKRRLNQSITDVLLEEVKNPDYGTAPEYLY